MSFRLRILLVTITLCALLFSVGGAILVHTSFSTSLEKEEKEAVENNEFLLNILQMVGEDSDWFGESELVSVIRNIGMQGSMDVLVLMQEETVVYQYENENNLKNAIKTEVKPEEKQVLITYFSTAEGEIYLQTTSRLNVNNKNYLLSIGHSLTPIYEVRNQQIEVLQNIFWVLLILGAFLSWIMTTILTRPLRKLARASKEIGKGNLSYRSRISSEDEIGALSREFDRMADRLEENILLLKESAEQQEQFMGAFTHELKTPMTSIIGYADLLRTQKLSPKDEIEALDYIFSEGKRLENMSLKMLDLFVADKKDFVMKECSPAGLTRYVAKHLQNVYGKQGIWIQIRAEEGNCLLEQDLFQTLLINLLDNARKAMEKGGIIYVFVKMTKHGCILAVQDQGKGIPKEAIMHLTEAFYRVDKARARSAGSAGLGLALCDKIVQLHHGMMHFESKEGVGTRVTVELNGGRNEEMEE